jgi:two-component system LytT family response regulator
MTTLPRLRAFVVDDEPLAVKRLIRLLNSTGRVDVTGSATDPHEALVALPDRPVDVLFLDIEMPGLTGFELLERLPSPPAVIFTTAYDQYALRAFDASSIDYLLKPIERVRLENALDRVERLGAHRPPDLQKTLEDIAAALKAPRGRFPDRIASKVGDRTQLIELARVSHFYAEDKLTYAATAPRPVLVDSTLGELEARLDPRRFLRIHRATLVNLAFVSELQSLFSSAVVKLKDERGTELAVARDRVKVLKERLGI